jgi:Na+/phosphate symporter
MRSKLLLVLKDLENIGDVLSKEMADLVDQKLERTLRFLPSDLERLTRFYDEVLQSYRRVQSFLQGDRSGIERVLLLELRIEAAKRAICQEHVADLGKDEEATLSSPVFLDLLNGVRRIHYYIADMVTVLEMKTSA